MQGTITETSIQGCKISVYLPPQYSEKTKKYPVLYLEDGAELFPLFCELAATADWADSVIAVGITPLFRDAAYTPWAAPALFSKAPSFAGEADEYLLRLCKIKDAIDTRYRTKSDPLFTGHLGISLSGLFCLYALHKTPVFGHTGSISGSLWYPWFVKYALEQPLAMKEGSVFLSLGKRESRGRNPVLKTVGDCTAKLYLHYKNMLGTKCTAFYSDEGGHTDHLQERLYAAVQFLLAHMLY